MNLSYDDIWKYYCELLSNYRRVSKRRMISLFAAMQSLTLAERQRFVKSMRVAHRRMYLDYFTVNFVDSVANIMRGES